MNRRNKRAFLSPLLSLPLLALATTAPAQTPAPTASRQQAPVSTSDTANASPDESVLGTVVADGSGSSSLPPLPKLAIVPLITTGTADSLVQLVSRRDLELSGQFDVLSDEASPPGPYLRDGALNLRAWKAKGAEYVLRVYAQPAPDQIKTELIAEAFLPPDGPAPKAGGDANDADGPLPKPAFHTSVISQTTELRAASHRLVDSVLAALTGRPGSFASEMVYAGRVGQWRRVFDLDADGFNLHSVGPTDATVMSPTFGPDGEIYYAISRDYAPFVVAKGPSAMPVPFAVPGSILGVAFSEDRSKIALTAMYEAKSTVYTGPVTDPKAIETAPFANHPVFGPLGKMAYVGGTPVQRVYINGKPISPPGFMASAPTFCETPEGLLVVYTVGVGSGSDIIATDSNGGGLRRLTQNQGFNTSPACSPDGRLLAYFSTAKGGKGPGLYVMPIARPWLAKKTSNEVGESLRWERRPGASK